MLELDQEDDGNPGLVCHVELDVKGPTDATIKKWTADILRKLADRIETEEFEDGHHPVLDNSGKEVGELYLDSYLHLDHD